MKKKRLANILMIIAAAAIIAIGVLLAGNHLGWFDSQDISETGVVSNVTGLVDLTRDNLASPLSADTVLRNGDMLATEDTASVSIQAGDAVLTLGSSSSVCVTSASASSFTLQLKEGQLFVQAGDTTVTLEFGQQTIALTQSTATLSVRTGSETLYLLAGSITANSIEYQAGQALSWTNNALTVDKFSPTALDDEALNWCLTALENGTLCFTSEELQSVLNDRFSQRQEEIESQLNTGDNPDASSDGSSSTSSEASDSPVSEGTSPSDAITPSNTDNTAGANTENTNQDTNNETPANAPAAEPEPEPEPEPVSKSTCTISIRCDTILNNMDQLDSGKTGYVPSSGVLLSTTTVEFDSGASVYDILKRACSAAGLSLEASYTPAYGSYYVEGIGNLYEFDCGSASGWMYKVNGWFPNYGCSSYTVSDGDTIVFCYTCDLGSDVGA